MAARSAIVAKADISVVRNMPSGRRVPRDADTLAQDVVARAEFVHHDRIIRRGALP
jgi:hypothetical protein